MHSEGNTVFEYELYYKINFKTFNVTFIVLKIVFFNII